MYQTEIEHLNERIAALGARVSELEDAVNFLLSHTNAPYVRSSPEQKATNEVAVIELLKKGKTMDALKLYRQVHPSTLQDAQKAIDELRKTFAG